MKITAVEALHLRLPEVEEVADGTQDCLLVRVHTDEGFTGLGRQILHCTFGSVLTHPELGPQLYSLLQAHNDTYTEVLADHFGRHLEALQAGLATAD